MITFIRFSNSGNVIFALPVVQHQASRLNFKRHVCFFCASQPTRTPSFTIHQSRQQHTERLNTERLITWLFLASLMNQYGFTHPNNLQREQYPSYHKESDFSSGANVRNEQPKQNNTKCQRHMDDAITVKALDEKLGCNQHSSDYAILGLPEGASVDEVKKAYKKLCLKFHPDKNYSQDEQTAEVTRRALDLVQEAFSNLKSLLNFN
jgi:hypothetical protein